MEPKIHISMWDHYSPVKLPSSVECQNSGANLVNRRVGEEITKYIYFNILRYINIVYILENFVDHHKHAKCSIF